MPHRVSTYRPEDREACRELLLGLRGWFDDADTDHALRHLTPEEGHLLRDGDGTVLGILCLNRRPWLWDGPEAPYVELVAVRGGHEGEGLGRMLMAEAERLAAAEGRVWLEMLEEPAGTPRYRARCGFYEGLGYRCLGTYPSEGWGPGSRARAYGKVLG